MYRTTANRGTEWSSTAAWRGAHTNSSTIKEGPIDPSHINREHHCLYAAQGIRRGARTCNDKWDQPCICLEFEEDVISLRYCLHNFSSFSSWPTSWSFSESKTPVWCMSKRMVLIGSFLGTNVCQIFSGAHRTYTKLFLFNPLLDPKHTGTEMSDSATTSTRKNISTCWVANQNFDSDIHAQKKLKTLRKEDSITGTWGCCICFCFCRTQSHQTLITASKLNKAAVQHDTTRWNTLTCAFVGCPVRICIDFQNKILTVEVTSKM